MNKEEAVDYLNRIKPYINLSAVCEDYNKNSDVNIDYNNLRAELNGNSKTRVSTEKLNIFIEYLYNNLYKNVFLINNIDNFISREQLDPIVYAHYVSLVDEIMEVKYGFRNK